MAAWLVGSFGNGSADAVLTRSVQEVGRFGETVWLQEVPGNAPSGGAYASAGFKSVPLPIAVDWYWQRLGQALCPSDAHLLFDKAGVRPPDPPASFAELISRRDLHAGADLGRAAPSDADRIGFFWAMVPVAAKYGVRGWDEKAERILRGLGEQVDTIGTAPARGRTRRRDASSAATPASDRRDGSPYADTTRTRNLHSGHLVCPRVHEPCRGPQTRGMEVAARERVEAASF